MSIIDTLKKKFTKKSGCETESKEEEIDEAISSIKVEECEKILKGSLFDRDVNLFTLFTNSKPLDSEEHVSDCVKNESDNSSVKDSTLTETENANGDSSKSENLFSVDVNYEVEDEDEFIKELYSEEDEKVSDDEEVITIV